LATLVLLPFLGSTPQYSAVTLSPRVENLIGDSLDRGRLSLAPDTGRSLLERITGQVESAVASGLQPVVLTSARVRGALRGLLEPSLPHVAVLSFAEVAAGTPVTSVGTVKLDDE